MKAGEFMRVARENAIRRTWGNPRTHRGWVAYFAGAFTFSLVCILAVIAVLVALKVV